MKSYAFNYSPQTQTFGQPFLYDGEHDFEYWKLTHPNVNYQEYWHGIRDAFVNRNFNIVESLTSNISKAPIKDIANFTAGMTNDLRIAQVISSKKAWESVRDITNGTGTSCVSYEQNGNLTIPTRLGWSLNVFGITTIILYLHLLYLVYNHVHYFRLQYQ